MFATVVRHVSGSEQLTDRKCVHKVIVEGHLNEWIYGEKRRGGRDRADNGIADITSLQRCVKGHFRMAMI
ncbi:MAG: hypothetical protein ABSH08_00590 [Tepidisphaeraceae bacterium]